MLPLTAAPDSYDTNFGDLDLFAGFPCPLKVPIETELRIGCWKTSGKRGLVLQTIP